jgi:hypothetical protein
MLTYSYHDKGMQELQAINDQRNNKYSNKKQIDDLQKMITLTEYKIFNRLCRCVPAAKIPNPFIKYGYLLLFTFVCKAGAAYSIQNDGKH